jgi:hypothetical protein
LEDPTTYQVSPHDRRRIIRVIAISLFCGVLGSLVLGLFRIYEEREVTQLCGETGMMSTQRQYRLGSWTIYSSDRSLATTGVSAFLGSTDGTTIHEWDFVQAKRFDWRGARIFPDLRGKDHNYYFCEVQPQITLACLNDLEERVPKLRELIRAGIFRGDCGNSIATTNAIRNACTSENVLVRELNIHWLRNVLSRLD